MIARLHLRHLTATVALTSRARPDRRWETPLPMLATRLKEQNQAFFDCLYMSSAFRKPLDALRRALLHTQQQRLPFRTAIIETGRMIAERGTSRESLKLVNAV